MTANNDDGPVLEPRQNQLHSALKTESAELAQIYFSALQVLSQTDNKNRFHLVAHAVREMVGKLPQQIDVSIEDGARQRLSDFVDTVNQEWVKMRKKGRWPGDPRWQGDIDGNLRKFLIKIETMLESGLRIKKGRKGLIQSVIRKRNYHSILLPQGIEDRRTKEWIEYHDYFTKIAHFNPADEATFLSYLERFEHSLLNYLEPRTFEVQDDIKKIIDEGENSTPTKAHVSVALGKIQRTADYNFFFESLKSPDWLSLLDELKMLDRPGEPLEEGGLVTSWSAAQYLVRIAAQEPEKVMQVILKAALTKSQKCYKDFLDATLLMPPMVSVRLYTKVMEWLGSSDEFFFLRRVGDYIVHIKTGGFIEEALQVVEVLLGPKKEKQLKDDSAKQDSVVLRRCDIEKIVPAFQNQDKVALIKLLCEKLHQEILFRNQAYISDSMNFGYRWRRSIEDSDQNYKLDIKDDVIDWIRNLSEELLTEAPDLVAPLCGYFRHSSFSSLSRFALHLARLSGRADLASQFILRSTTL